MGPIFPQDLSTLTSSMWYTTEPADPVSGSVASTENTREPTGRVCNEEVQSIPSVTEHSFPLPEFVPQLYHRDKAFWSLKPSVPLSFPPGLGLWRQLGGGRDGSRVPPLPLPTTSAGF